jgi:hypothetical protein
MKATYNNNKGELAYYETQHDANQENLQLLIIGVAQQGTELETLRN